VLRCSSVSADDEERESTEDVLFFHGTTEDGQGLRAIRKRSDRLELCAVRAAQDGEPIRGELASLKRRQDSPHLYDVEVHFASEQVAERAPPRPTSGPAKVASRTYRTGWDRIWGTKSKRSIPN
jgi:hypothetical protein